MEYATKRATRQWYNRCPVVVIAATILMATFTGGCAYATATPTATPTPLTPYPGLDALVGQSDLGVVGDVVAVSDLQTANNGQTQIWFYDATVDVGQTLFGQAPQQLTVRVPMYTGPHVPTKAPLLGTIDHVVLLLTKLDDTLRPAPDGTYGLSVTYPGGGAFFWGAFLSVEDTVRPYLEPDSSYGVEDLNTFLTWIRDHAPN